MKFWAFDANSQRYTLDTCVDPAHTATVTALTAHPSGKMFVTAGLDRCFKGWVRNEVSSSSRTAAAWRCLYVGNYLNTPCTDAAFSIDGSILAVSFGSTVALWEPQTSELLQTLHPPTPYVSP